VRCKRGDRGAYGGGGSTSSSSRALTADGHRQRKRARCQMLRCFPAAALPPPAQPVGYALLSCLILLQSPIESASAPCIYRIITRRKGVIAFSMYFDNGGVMRSHGLLRYGKNMNSRGVQDGFMKSLTVPCTRLHGHHLHERYTFPSPM